MILCCGEALIDMLPRETTLGEKGFAPYAGGAVFNTAIALGRLGQPTAFFTGMSDDMMGHFKVNVVVSVGRQSPRRLRVTSVSSAWRPPAGLTGGCTRHALRS